MPLTILDSTTAAAIAAATTQHEQLTALVEAFGGDDVQARLYASATHLRTLTLPELTVVGNPPAVTLGAHLADTPVNTGTPTHWILRTDGGTEILQMSAGVGSGDVQHAGAVKTLCTPTLNGVTIGGDPDLPTTMPAWLSGVAVNEWVQAAAAPSDGGLAPAVAGSMGSQSGMVNAWCGAFAHAGRFYIHGGGHADYGGNEVGFVDLNASAPAWDLLMERTPVADLLGGSNYYADGNPTSRHTYYAMAVADVGGVPTMLRFNGWMGFAYNGAPVGGSADVRTTDIDGLNLSTGVWAPAAYGPVTAITGSETAFAQDPVTGDCFCWHTDSNKIQRYDVSADSCSVLGNPSGTDGGGAAMVYDADNGRLVRFAGRGDHKCTYWDGSAKQTPTLIGPDASAISGLTGSNHGWGIAHDTSRNVAYLLSAGLTLYRIRLDDWYVEALTTTGETPATATSGCWGKLKYIPELDGIAYLASWTSPLLFMRVA